MPRDEQIAFETRCAVTAFDMKIQLNRDGRERGVWIFLDDESESRTSTYKSWLENAVEITAQFMDVKESESIKKFRAFMSINGEIGRLANGKIHEGALMEWPKALKFYEAMGKEIRAARKRGDLPAEKKPAKKRKAKR
jgi:hypothetical protein